MGRLFQTWPNLVLTSRVSLHTVTNTLYTEDLMWMRTALMALTDSTDIPQC
jgi:hypothetical protein